MTTPIKLAVYSPVLGAYSETFIQRHITSLLPDDTVIITKSFSSESNRFSKYPMFNYTENLTPPFFFRANNKIKKMLCLKGRNYTTNRLIAFLKKHSVNTILGEYLDCSHHLISLTKKLGIRLFVHAHGYDLSRTFLNPEWKEKYKQYNEIAGLITVNTLQRDRLIDIGIEPSKIALIPYGTDMPPSPPEKTKDKQIHCLAVGRMVSQKAPILLLDAFRRAQEIVPDLVLNYIGDGYLLTAAMQYIEAFDLSRSVKLHRALPHSQVKQFMDEADIFLQHSVVVPTTGDEEGLPVAILEAMAHALPVVATEHAGIPGAQIHNETGFLVPEGDTRNMAQYIAQLAVDVELRNKMGKAARERAQKLYAWEINKRNLLHFMKNSDYRRI